MKSQKNGFKKALLIAENLNNIGDLVLTIQTAKGLREHCKVESVNVWQWKRPSAPVVCFFRAYGIKIIHGKWFMSLFNYKTLIAISGGQFIRENNSRSFLFTLYLTILTSIFLRSKIAALSIGVTNLSNNVAIKRWKNILRLFQLITVRDQTSKNNLEKFIGKSQAVHLTDDLAFLPTDLFSIYQHKHPTQKTVVIAPCGDLSDGRYINYDVLTQLTQLLIKTLQVDHVTILAHDQRAEIDYQVCTDIEKKLLEVCHVKVKFVASTTDIGTYFSTYNDCAAVVTNRLHSVIFGLVFKKPIFVIDDSNQKLLDISEKFKIPRISQKNPLTNDIAEILKQEIQNSHDLLREKQLEKSKNDAEFNFKLINHTVR